MMIFLRLMVLLTATNVAKCFFFQDSINMFTDVQLVILKELQFETLYGRSCKGLDEGIESFRNCAKKIDKATETACSAFLNYSSTCSKPFFESFKSCLPEESKYLPKIINQAAETAVSYLCKSDGEHLFEIFNQCIFKPNQHYDACVKIFDSKVEEYSSVPPTKDELCAVIQKTRICFMNHVKEACKSKITKELFMELFDAVYYQHCETTGDKKTEKNDIAERIVLE